jgi:hypothetical protein
VWEWFVSVRIKNSRMHRPIIQKYAKEMGKSDFKASDGWLGRFRKFVTLSLIKSVVSVLMLVSKL